MKTHPVDVLLYDVPDEWEGWPFSRSLVAFDFGQSESALDGADRVEVMIRRGAYPQETLRPLIGTITALAKNGDSSIAIIEGYRLDGHDMRGLYFAMPSSCVHRVISRIDKGH